MMGFDIKIMVKTIDSLCASWLYDYGSEKKCYTSLKELGSNGLKLLESEPNIIRDLQYIFFDEFQDVNIYQFLILKKMVSLKISYSNWR